MPEDPARSGKFYAPTAAQKQQDTPGIPLAPAENMPAPHIADEHFHHAGVSVAARVLILISGAALLGKFLEWLLR